MCQHARITLHVEIDREDDGRWIADIPNLAGVMAYGLTPDEAKANVEALAFRVLADQIEEPRKQFPLLSSAK